MKKWNKAMNIESQNVGRNSEIQTNNTKSKAQNNTSSVSFADELKDITTETNSKTETEGEELKKPEKTDKSIAQEEQNVSTDSEQNTEKTPSYENNDKNQNLGKACEDLSLIVKQLNQSEDKPNSTIKKDENFTENNNMINNDFNIQENKDLLPQMNPNMNFSGDGQPFSSFMNNGNEQTAQDKLKSSVKDLAEEAAILSTMEENIAIANKNQVLNNTKTVTNEEGVKKVDIKTGIKVETIVQYDSIIMNEADVEVFSNLVQNGEIDMNNLAPKAAEKSVQVSKTLADMLAKSMENNQPVRINFDNNISVIIRISRDGKITADFLPSSQVAEAYLKENLPLLRQRFDDNNIDYDSLNQRERQNSDKKDNRKKERNNE